MTRAGLKKIVKAAIPSVTFVEADGLGTQTPRYRIECRLPTDHVSTLEAFATSIGKKAYPIWVGCYGNNSIRCINI
jgi:hypothetical protein